MAHVKRQGRYKGRASPPGGNKIITTVRFPPHLVTALDEMAEAEGRSRANLIQRVLTEKAASYMRTHRRLGAAKRLEEAVDLFA